MSTKTPTKVISAVRDLPVTVFAPKEKEAHLGIFKGQQAVYLRVTGSHAISFNPQTREWDNQYGQVIAFNNLARKLAGLIANSDKGSLSIRVYARQEVTPNIQDNTLILNTQWLLWGFEYNGVFYTTKNGELVQTDGNRARATESHMDDTKDMLAQQLEAVSDSRLSDLGDTLGVEQPRTRSVTRTLTVRG